MSSIRLPDDVVKDLSEMFDKYQINNTKKINPKQILRTFNIYDFKETRPPIYYMMEWICEAHDDGYEMTFEELLKDAIFFFS